MDSVRRTSARIRGLRARKIDAQSARQYHNTVSCDQLMAEVTSKYTRFASLELSINSGTGQPNNSCTLAFSRDGVPLPAEDTPRNVFDRLFGEDKGGVAVRRARLAKRRSVLDAVLDDAKSLRGTLGADDGAKLDEYLHSVRDVEQRTERLNVWLNVPKPKVDGSAFSGRFPRPRPANTTAPCSISSSSPCAPT